jgi:hypothetical protein
MFCRHIPIYSETIDVSWTAGGTCLWDAIGTAIQGADEVLSAQRDVIVIVLTGKSVSVVNVSVGT